ncbi:hypothetical protein E2C01_035624 [Portunus trituberculatus]|uniref:Uncharacterized protein n=1 Tax=Portunus trituberculatus TaxID=210409 RepID=A0A5B7F4N9_PORTR|nr:hypothetical protein [Portunus trituberculatus]
MYTEPGRQQTQEATVKTTAWDGGEVHGEGGNGDGHEEESPHPGGKREHVYCQSVLGGTLGAAHDDT